MRVLLLAWLASCAEKEPMRPVLDAEGWRALAEEIHPALEHAFAEDLDPVGTWKLDGLSWTNGPTLQVKRVTEEVFDLWFFPSRPEGAPLRTRAARVEGVLVLVEPAALFVGEPVSALFPVRTHGRECLVPDVHLAHLGRAEPRLDQPSDGASGWAFLRAEASTPLDAHWIATPPD